MNERQREAATEAVDWTRLDLGEGGRSLIEASAGTGKTWTISVLYLRLLLERGLGPRQIVVTTFTDAAAQELRERIRARLRWAERIARDDSAPAKAEDQAEAWLRSRWQRGESGEPDRAAVATDINRLRLAAADLDQAPIGTLHGLCRRILADHPFESGGAFELGVAVPPDTINAELADDLWRRLGQTEQPLCDGDRLWWKGGAGRTELDRYLRVVLAPGVGVETLALNGADEIMRPENAIALRRWLGDGAQFRRANSRLRSRLSKLAEFIENGDIVADWTKASDLAAVLDEPRENHLRPGALKAAQDADALKIADRAAAVIPRIGAALRSTALARYRKDLRALRRTRLIASGEMTFDELIERAADALERNAALGEALAAAWPAALVDEFQDTDAQQYAILDRIYARSGAAMRGRLVMIGDPKQAIYRFRGGDIDAYLDARATATSGLVLDVNFRASRPLVAALNAFYARAGNVMSSDRGNPIAYQPVRASPRLDDRPYRIDGAICERPLHFHYWDGRDVPQRKHGRVGAALEACANHVVDLLDGRHTIGRRAVQPRDIAVLLPTGRQIAQLRDLLRQRGVPCVSTSWSSVFASEWARELQVFLYAVLHPRDDGAVRAALATRLGGHTYASLRALRDRPDAWQREAEAFAALNQLWRRRGVLALVQRLAADAAGRLFTGDGGERALTDLRHLGELLQAHSEEIAGREELLTWLADERRRSASEVGNSDTDERQLRLESDADRVRLLTLHASKGLEFPIVLLPLMWDNRQSRRDTIAVVHDEAARQRAVTFTDTGKQRHELEGQDERFRLLYVALTRAQHACHVYALPPDRPAAGNSPKPDSDPARAPLDALIERLLATVEPPQTLQHVAWSVGPWTWPWRSYRETTADAGAEPRVLSPPPDPVFEATWSFSALAQGAVATPREEEPASDEAPGGAAAEAQSGESALPGLETPSAAHAEPEHAALAWLAPIAGADFGNAVHAIFERRVIGRPMSMQHALVERCLLDEGVGLRGIALDELVPHLAGRVQTTLDTPLPAEGRDGTTLGALPKRALCTEMPFEFVIGEVSLRRLGEVCPFLPPTPLQTLRGMMTGQIDLVYEHAGRFHVLDYKSNRLGFGTRLSDYAGEALARAMSDDHYRFQALLYTVAVDRYLRERITGYRRDRHLGVAIYLFVRAVGIAPDFAPRAGIWSERFDDALIDAVDATLAGDAGRDWS